MTTKGKAEEIFNQHYAILLDADSDISQEVLISVLAKKMALVTVDEIIYNLSHKAPIIHFYWNQVKQEIEKL